MGSEDCPDLSAGSSSVGVLCFDGVVAAVSGSMLGVYSEEGSLTSMLSTRQVLLVVWSTAKTVWWCADVVIVDEWFRRNVPKLRQGE